MTSISREVNRTTSDLGTDIYAGEATQIGSTEPRVTNHGVALTCQ
jgi:hypothetical protein